MTRAVVVVVVVTALVVVVDGVVVVVVGTAVVVVGVVMAFTGLVVGGAEVGSLNWETEGRGGHEERVRQK